MSDYIKREDVLQTLLERKQPSNGADNTKERWRYIQWLGDYNTIADFPSADVVEVRHGHWKVYKDLGHRFVKNYQCSECGDIIGDVNYNYCPNCGARMDGEEE